MHHWHCGSPSVIASFHHQSSVSYNRCGHATDPYQCHSRMRVKVAELTVTQGVILFQENLSEALMVSWKQSYDKLE